MIQHAVIAPVLVPLAMGFVLLFMGTHGHPALRRGMSVASVVGLLALALTLLAQSADGMHRVYALGNWVAPFGIVLVLDRLTALMLVLTDLLALGALLYAIFNNEDERGSHFHPLFQLQLFGLHGAFLTGDVFNLFVFFEILLLASYGLLLHGGGRLRTRAGLHYVVINLLGSTLFLFAVGALYGVLGTLNLADMAVRIGQAPAEDHGVIAAAGLLLFAVFGLKAAFFPLYLWLPGAYAHTSAAVAALFAIMTKVGLYAIVRVHGTLFGTEAGALEGLIAPWLTVLGWITIVLAALGVMASRFLREQVAYLVLASVGMLAIGFGLGTPAGWSASLYYLIHSTMLAGGFFLLADAVRRARSTVEDHFEDGHDMPYAIVLGGLFFAFAIALAGMPPLSGFFGKLMILSAGLDDPRWGMHLAVILLASFLIILALARSGSQLFYRTLGPASKTHDETPTSKTSLVVITGMLVTAPMMVILAELLTTWLDATAMQMMDHRAYIRAVFSLTAHEATP